MWRGSFRTQVAPAFPPVSGRSASNLSAPLYSAAPSTLHPAPLRRGGHASTFEAGQGAGAPAHQNRSLSSWRHLRSAQRSQAATSAHTTTMATVQAARVASAIIKTRSRSVGRSCRRHRDGHLRRGGRVRWWRDGNRGRSRQCLRRVSAGLVDERLGGPGGDHGGGSGNRRSGPREAHGRGTSSRRIHRSPGAVFRGGKRHV